MKKAHELDQAAMKADEVEKAAATKARLARDVTTVTALEPYAAAAAAVVPRSPGTNDLVEDGFLGINWRFLDSISAFISKCIITTLTRNAPRLLRLRLIACLAVVATVIVAVTVCAEGVLEPPAFLLRKSYTPVHPELAECRVEEENRRIDLRNHI